MQLDHLDGSFASASLLALSLMTSVASAQARYDFNGLNGSDTHPFTPLDGQGGWSEETYGAANRCGVTATLSHDGTKSLRFQEVGPGYGCDASRINDAAWSFPAFTGNETNAYYQVDLLVGFWGGSYGPAFDTNNNGRIRGAEAGERGVRFTIGTQAGVQLRLVGANDAFVQTPLAGLGIAGGNWVRIRVVMDLAAAGGTGLGSIEVQNLTTGATGFTPVAGLSSVPLGLSPTAIDATNPARWNAMWLHFEGATYGLDNVEIGTLAPGTNYCTANPNSTGNTGAIRATGSASVTSNDLVLVAERLPNSSFGYFLTSLTQGTVPNPGGSQGVLCLGGSIGRYVGPGQIKNSGTTGTFSLALDLMQTPSPGGFVAVASGQTWSFQAWHRDAVGGSATSNFTNGLAVGFQ
jgi:hypothetical protein